MIEEVILPYYYRVTKCYS